MFNISKNPRLAERQLAEMQKAREWRMPVIESYVFREGVQTVFVLGRALTTVSVADITLARIRWMEER